MENIFIFGCVALVLILALTFFNDKVKATVFGLFNLDARTKDGVNVKNIKNKSDLDIKNREGQDIDVQDIDDSKIKIN